MCCGAKSTRKDPRPGEKKMPKGSKNTFMYMYKVPLREVTICRGVAKERNEKHPAWTTYRYAANSRISIGLVSRYYI